MDRAAAQSIGAKRVSAASGAMCRRETERLTAPTGSPRAPVIAAPSEMSLGKIYSTATA
jgi:hypothetical protein